MDGGRGTSLDALDYQYGAMVTCTALHQQKIENPMRPREAISGVVKCHMYYNILQTSYKYCDASNDLCLFS